MDRIAAGWKAKDLASDAKAMVRRKCEEEKADLRAHADALADRLQSAVDRINDMLEGDDGQAWKEAEKVLPLLKEALTAYRNRGE